MRLSYLLELVLALGVGFGLARYRISNPDWADYHPGRSPIDWSEEAIGCVLAGTAFVSGLGTFLERARGKVPGAWGPGRWSLASLCLYLTLSLLDDVAGTVASHYQGLHQNTTVHDILEGFRGRYYEFLPPDVAWFLLALGVVSLAAPSKPRERADAREWTGRMLAALIVVAALVFRCLSWFGVRPQGMGGGFQ